MAPGIIEKIRAQERRKSLTALKRTPSDQSLPEILELQIPRAEKCHHNVVLEKLNETTGLWQSRRLFCTSKVLGFSKLDEANAIAIFQLWEIEEIVAVGQLATRKPEQKDDERVDLARVDSFVQPGEGQVKQAQNFEVRQGGRQNGVRKFKFRMKSAELCDQLLADLMRLVKEAKEIHRRQTAYDKSKTAVRILFESTPFQMTSALLIFANFIFNVVQAQTLPEEGSEEEASYARIDLCFTGVFTVELVINAYGHWWMPFFTNAWSLFDLLVVSVSLLAVIIVGIPGVGVLRLIRVFRVIRLFGRLKALRKIISALSKSIIPVLNSFVILLLITCIYALIGVNFFSETAPEKFGTFAHAVITMFILTSGESWIEELPAFDENGAMDAGATVFLVSYIVIVNWTLLQVSVAVLLDNFVVATGECEEVEEMQRRAENPVRIASPALDPLLRVLTDNFDSENDLAFRINWIFDLLDVDEAGLITRDQIMTGMNGLSLDQHVEMLSEDLDHILLAAGLTGEAFSKEDFQQLMMMQVLEFVQRRVSDVVKVNIDNEVGVAQLTSFKMVFSMLDRLEKKVNGKEALKANEMQQQENNQRIDAFMAHLGVEDPVKDDPEMHPFKTIGLTFSKKSGKTIKLAAQRKKGTSM